MLFYVNRIAYVNTKYCNFIGANCASSTRRAISASVQNDLASRSPTTQWHMRWCTYIIYIYIYKQTKQFGKSAKVIKLSDFYFFLFSQRQIRTMKSARRGESPCDTAGTSVSRIIGTSGVRNRRTLDNTASIEVAGTATEEEPVPGERRRRSCAARPRRS